MDEENLSQESDWYDKLAASVASENAGNFGAKRVGGRRPSSLSMTWCSRESEGSSRALNRWWKAVRQICKREDDIDPWHNLPLCNFVSESAIRYRYSAIKKRWVQDDIRVKLENLPFDHGAMRECFRLKKLSSSAHNGDSIPTSNYVAKKYINLVPREVYFEDVKLQMESKLWAEEYNRQNPPKKIDIFQLSVIELTERENRPLYHIEHFMEGNYRKYNSNSGFVDDSSLRNTPQTFSHFTFERSGHRIIIVDIQGVGDLYTDPQIHTADGLNYGDGNLGLRGMALFFSSHQCNSICNFLGLSEFDMEDSELSERGIALLNNDDSDSNVTDNHLEEDLSVFSDKAEAKIIKRNRSISFKISGTVVRDDRNSPINASPIFLDKLYPAPVDLMRALSLDSGVLSASTPFISHNNLIASSMADSGESLNSVISGGNFQWLGQSLNSQQNDSKNGNCIVTNSSRKLRRRQRNYSDGSDIDAALMTHEDYLTIYHSMKDNQKPASASHPTNLDQEIGHSILAQVHHELARLHESGRLARYKQKEGALLHQHFWSHVLTSEGKNDFQNQESVTDRGIEVNWDACLFHERQAAQLGCLEAVITIARYSLNMSGHMLQDCPIPPTENDKDCGLDYLWRAADSGDRRSMIELANMYKNSSNIESYDEKLNFNGFSRNPVNVDWAEAVKWYKRAFEAVNKTDGQTDAKDAEGRYDSADDLLPPQQLLAAMAELYLKGGFGLEVDYQLAGDLYSEAAEIATNALKGREAVKYYELADEAFSKVNVD